MSNLGKFLQSFGDRRWLICIGFLAMLVYLPKLPNQLVGDDRDFLERWPALSQWSSIPKLIGGDLPEAHQGTYRPVRSLFYLGMYQAFGANPVPYHIFGIAVHMAVSVLWTVLLLQLSKLPRLVAVSAGLTFALHPLHTEAISFITASFDSLAFVFVLLSLILYDASRTRAGLVVGLLALGSNEVAFVLPVLLMTILWMQGKKLSTSTYLWVATLLFLGIRFGWVGVVNRGEYLGGSFWSGLAVSLKAAALYLWLLVWPFDLGLLHRLMGGISTFSYHDLYGAEVGLLQWQDPRLWLVGLGLAAGVAVSLYGLFHRRVWGLALVWIWLPLLPVLNLIPSAVPLSERYAYLASTGFCLLLGLVVQRLRFTAGPKLAVGFLGLVLVVYGFKTVSMQSVWRNEVVYWQYQVGREPTNATGWIQLGKVYQVEYQLDQAIHAYKTAISLDGRLGNAWHNLGTIYQYQGSFPEAIMAYQNARIRLSETIQQSAAMLQITRLYYAAELMEQGEMEMARLQETLVMVELDPPSFSILKSQVCQERPILCRPIE